MTEPVASTPCPRCAAPTRPGDVFCGRCGISLATGIGPPPSYGPRPPPPRSTRWTSYGAPLAQWWPRVGAMLLDALILAVPTGIVTGAVGAAGGGAGAAAGQFVLVLAIGAAYFGALNGLGRGQTLGNRAATIAVRDARDGTEIGLARGLLRWFVRFALYLFVLPGLLSDLWPLWDRRRQTLADKAAGSVMVRLR